MIFEAEVNVANDKQIKIFDFNVVASGENEPHEFELDKNAEFVTGFVLTSDFDNMLFYRGSFRLEIGGVEYIPEKYESKLILTGINVAPNSRIYQLGNIPVGNGKIKITYKDTNHASAAFATYRVSLYVHCILKNC